MTDPVVTPALLAAQLGLLYLGVGLVVELVSRRITGRDRPSMGRYVKVVVAWPLVVFVTVVAYSALKLVNAEVSGE